MRKMRFLLSLLLLVGLARADQVEVAPDLKVSSVTFGLFQQDANGSLTFVPSSEVPLRPGQYFGWRMDLATERKTVKWREELELPRAPDKWGTDTQVGGDRKVGITEREEDVFNGWVVHIWKVAAGDPAGEYTLRLFLEDKPVGVLSFKVVAPEGSDATKSSHQVTNR